MQTGVSLNELMWMAPAWITIAWAVLTAVCQVLVAELSVRRWLPLVAATGAGLAAATCVSLLAQGSVLIHGIVLFDGRLWVDYPSLGLDLLICLAVVAAVVREESRRPASFDVLCLAAAGGSMLAAHAGDFVTLSIGLEVACLALAGMLAPRAVAATRWMVPQAAAMAITWVGMALCYGGAGTLKWRDLSLQAVTVFTKWGAGTTQKAVEILLEPELPIAAGGIEQLRDAAVTGMAPAALFVPGLLLTFAGLSLRVGLFAGLRRASWSVFIARDGIVRLGAFGALFHLGITVVNVPRLTYPPYGWSFGLILACTVGLVLAAVGAFRAGDLRTRVLMTGLHQAACWGLALAAAGELFAYAGLTFAGVRHEAHYNWALESGEQVVAALGAMIASTAVATIGLMVVAPGRRAIGCCRRAPILGIARTLLVLAFVGAPISAGFFARGWTTLAVLADSNLLVRVVLLVACVTTVAIWAAWLPIVATWWRSGGEDEVSVSKLQACVALCMTVASYGAVTAAPTIHAYSRFWSIGASMHGDSTTRSRRVGEWYEQAYGDPSANKVPVPLQPTQGPG